MNLHICLIFQVERNHVKEHIERLIDKAGHQKYQGNGLALVVDIDRGERADKSGLAADEAENLPLLVPETGAENPYRDQ